MLRAIQPRAVRLHSIEEQDVLPITPVGVHNYRNWIARFECGLIPSLIGHEAGARSLDVPSSYRRRICSVGPHDDDDVAVRILPPILLYDAAIGNIFGHIEHRARMMSEARTWRS
jgi:hypothetical protein